MTLIAGTPTWNGVLVCSDTRATHKKNDNTYTYSDDVLKLDILPSGVGMAVAGDCRTATLFRKVLINNFNSNTQTSDTYDGPSEIIKSIIENSLKELALKDEIYKIDPNDTEICGLISAIDSGANLRLDSTECKKLIEIQGKKNFTNKIWSKYKDKFLECADNKKQFVEISEYKKPVLFSFRSKIGNGMYGGVLDVKIVSFGEIAVWGSGKSLDHEEQQLITLSYALFGVEPENIDDASMHILRTHGWSDLVVPTDKNCGFKTFGGGYLAGMFIQMPDSPERVELKVVLGDLFKQPDKKELVCSIFIKEDKLCIKTNENKEWVLKKFWEYQSVKNTYTKLSAE